jgi:hypothetical protein
MLMRNLVGVVAILAYTSLQAQQVAPTCTGSVVSKKAWIHDAPTRKRTALYVVRDDNVQILDYSRGMFNIRYTNRKQVTTEGWVWAANIRPREIGGAKVVAQKAVLHPTTEGDSATKPYVTKGQSVGIIMQTDEYVLVAYHAKKGRTLGWVKVGALSR